MATLHELRDEILKGRKVKRACLNEYIDKNYRFTRLELEYILTLNDWELEPLPKAKKKIKLYAYMSDRERYLYFDTKDNNQYGDRLSNLDQEIEVEE